MEKVSTVQPKDMTSSDRRYPSPPTALLLGSVVSVVLLVSFPSLETWAARSNQADAREAVTVLGPELAALAQRPNLWEFLRADPARRVRFQDARPLQAGDLVRYHGYYLQWRDGALMAWPQVPGRSGSTTWTWREGVLEAIPLRP